MHRRLLLLTGLAALVALAGVVPAAAQMDDTPVLEYERLVATASLTLSENGGSQVSDLGGSLVTVDSAGLVLSHRPFHTSASEFRTASADLPDFPCVYDSGREGFIAYPPANLSVDERNEKGGFRFFPYSVDGARRGFGQERTVQFLMCGVGGVDAQNGSRLTVSGPGMAYNDSDVPHILGTNWKSGKTPKDYSISLAFQTDGTPVSVSGGISQNPSNSLKGSVVPPTAGTPWSGSTRTPPTPGGKRDAGRAAGDGTEAPTTRAPLPRLCGSSPRKPSGRSCGEASSWRRTTSTSAPTRPDADQLLLGQG